MLRCERVGLGDVDRALARLGPTNLARSPEGSFVEVADADADRATRALAFAGVRASPSTVKLAPQPGARGALGRDLSPFPIAAIALDLVHLRALPLGEEIWRLLRGNGAAAGRQAICRALLRGEDIVIGWRRRAWCSSEFLRSQQARRSLRPVIFDAAALAAPPEHRSLVRDRALAAWLFA